MDLFVYGTLRSPALMAAVAGAGPLDHVGATLSGFLVYPLAGNVVPFVRADADAQTIGMLWRNLSDTQVARLDAYEGAFGYVLDPVTVDTADGPAAAKC